jgi:hypothetical protein
VSQTNDAEDHAPDHGQQPASSWAELLNAMGPQQYLPPSPSYGGNTSQISDEASPILVSFASPAKQRRVTILLRLILVIPHVVLLLALTIAADVVAFIGWWAALFTGELPDWAHIFITGWMRWQARVYAYLFMLTDRYPPFALDENDYPVRLVSRLTRLNRLAVFFRWILVVPARIVMYVILYGVLVLWFFIWLIALIAGGLPPALHQAIAAVVRYQARYNGYWMMATSEYPKGLYGDYSPAESSADAASAATPGQDPGPDIASASAWAAGTVATLAQPDMTNEAAWRLRVSEAAKIVVTLFVVVGAVAYVVLTVLNFVSTSRNADLAQVQQANSVLSQSSRGVQSAMQACGSFSCAEIQLTKQVAHWQTFDSQINAIGLSAQPGSDAAKLVSDDHVVEQDLNQIANATTASQYLSLLNTTGLEADVRRSDAAYRKLVADLGGATS